MPSKRRIVTMPIVNSNHENLLSIITLSGGELFSGICIVLTLQMLWSFGLELSLLHDRKRQTILNIICLAAALNGSLAYPINESHSSVIISNITTLFMFFCVQYGLVIVNHNTIARANQLSQRFEVPDRMLNIACLFLYILPLAVFVPTFFAMKEISVSEKLINHSKWNMKVYKSINIALVLLTELFAVITDGLLFKNIHALRKSLLRKLGHSSEVQTEKIKEISRDLIVSYFFTWFFLVLDITVKILIINKKPILFDSILTICTIAMRAKCNLQYGLYMRDMFLPVSTNSNA